MKAATYDVRESDPFTPQQTFGALRTSATAPIAGRIEGLWETFRGIAVDVFPQAPGLPEDMAACLRFIDQIYSHDAYHSLSIDGYRVTPELIERVRSGSWDPDRNAADRQNRDALAACGYWQAFQTVKANVVDIIGGGDPGTLVRTTHRDWYRELFQPRVAAGLFPASALAGYRNAAFYLPTSRYVPPRWEAVRDAMPALFDLLEQEAHPAARRPRALAFRLHPSLPRR
jgi:hypothetical protein